jgi:hypothetical protein
MENVFTYNDFVHRVEINEKGTIQLKIEVVPLGDPRRDYSRPTGNRARPLVIPPVKAQTLCK